MQVGMLWFDDSAQRDLAIKIERAVRHYETKYGMTPTTCYVHPSMLLSDSQDRIGLDIRANNMVLPNHFWLGISDEKQAKKRPAA